MENINTEVRIIANDPEQSDFKMVVAGARVCRFRISRQHVLASGTGSEFGGFVFKKLKINRLKTAPIFTCRFLASKCWRKGQVLGSSVVELAVNFFGKRMTKRLVGLLARKIESPSKVDGVDEG